MPLFKRPDLDIPEAPDRWRRALEAALSVSEIAAADVRLPQALDSMVRVAMSLLNAEQGSMMLAEEGGSTLVLVAASGLPPDIQPGHRLPMGESVAGRVLVTGQPLLLGEVDRDAFVNFIPKTRPISSSVVVPLRVQGRTIGVLNLAISASSVFTNDDMRMAQMFADQAAALIYRSRLHERAEHRSSDLMALVESSRGLLGILDLDSLLRNVLDGGTRLAGSNEGFACLFDPETGSLARGVFRGIDKPKISALLARDDVVRAIEDPDVAAVSQEGLPSLLAVGLRTPRGTKGLLVVGADAQLAADRGDLFRAFAQQCASAIGAAELHSVIERKESELASIIQGLPNGVIMVDALSRIVAINPAAEQILGVSEMFTAGAPVKGSLDNDQVESYLTQAGEIQGEIAIGRPPRTFKVIATDVRVPGAPIGRVLVMDDVTAEREMTQTHRDFVGMIGHELRTQLTIIKGFAATLLKRIDTATTEEARDALKTIDTRAAQLDRLIEDLLYVSKIETREATLRIEEADVCVLVRAVVDDVLREYRGRKVDVDLPDELCWPCDETKVSLVLRHLVENALKYSEEPAPVMVRARHNGDEEGGKEPDELQIDVVDKGLGLVSSDIPHIFDRFHQVDSSSTRRHGGTGVGLYLCAQLIRVHEGRIWVDSTWGKGSTFSFTIPRRAAANKVVHIEERRANQSA